MNEPVKIEFVFMDGYFHPDDPLWQRAQFGYRAPWGEVTRDFTRHEIETWTPRLRRQWMLWAMEEIEMLEGRKL
jgi:hypothetical protein